MERIKIAIEKAKAAGSQSPQNIKEMHLPAPASSGSELGEIKYSQTQVVELDPRHLEKHRIVALDKSNINSVSFDVLRTQVLQKMEENGWRTLAIVSPVPECGKTVVAINLAMSIAHHTGRTAMLVDFDLRKPKVAQYLGISSGTSLNEVLAGDVEVSRAFVNPGIPKLVVVPTARHVSNSSEILASAKVKDLIAELRNRYAERIVLIDLPPLLNVDDAMSILPEIDCALLVIGNGMVSKGEIEESLHHLKGFNLIGTILNKAEVQKRRYYY